MYQSFKHEVLQRLDALSSQQAQTLALLKELQMALSQDILDLSKKIDDATSAVAARIAALSGQIKNSMSNDEVAAVKTALQAEVDRLTALGSDPNNPVPPAPTPPAPPAP